MQPSASVFFKEVMERPSSRVNPLLDVLPFEKHREQGCRPDGQQRRQNFGILSDSPGSSLVNLDLADFEEVLAGS